MCAKLPKVCAPGLVLNALYHSNNRVTLSIFSVILVAQTYTF